MRGENSQETGDSISKSSSNSCSGSNEGLCGAGWIGCQCIVYAKDQNSIEFLGWILRVSLGGFSDLAIPFWGEVGWGCSTLGISEQFGGLWKTVATLGGRHDIHIHTQSVSAIDALNVDKKLPMFNHCCPLHGKILVNLEYLPVWSLEALFLILGSWNLQNLLNIVQSFKHVDRYLGIIYRKKGKLR